tara:strand:- start:91700 stop:92350 length:651 start_codon:yes stop_codon:yes gene_type:complete
MEDGSNKVTIGSFLHHQETKSIFANLDYMLKDGVHIQQVEKQIEYYNYIIENEDSLKLYYKELFEVNLSSGGEIPDKYYFLDFIDPNSRGNIRRDNRHYLKNEHIIIGFIIYEIIYIHKQIDLTSVDELKRKIRNDYDVLKPGLYRLIGKSKNINPSKLNDNAIDSAVKSALNEFSKIGWITLSDNEFEPLPAFDRLIYFYEKEILNIDEIFKEMQ